MWSGSVAAHEGMGNTSEGYDGTRLTLTRANLSPYCRRYRSPEKGEESRSGSEVAQVLHPHWGGRRSRANGLGEATEDPDPTE